MCYLKKQDSKPKDWIRRENENVVSKSWKYWWSPCVSEKEWNTKKQKYVTKGGVVKNKTGETINCNERLPLIRGVCGGADDVAQVLTSYS